jgi:hypothetical protein
VALLSFSGQRGRVNVALQTSDLYHTGIVVDDLRAAMRRMSDVGGYRWTAPITAPTVLRSGDRDTEVTFKFVYSLDAPHVELVETIPGTVWTPVAGNALHHLGYFVDDLDTASIDLIDGGLPVEVCGCIAGRAPAMFSYHKGGDGIRIEIVDRTAMGDWQEFLTSNLP